MSSGIYQIENKINSKVYMQEVMFGDFIKQKS